MGLRIFCGQAKCEKLQQVLEQNTEAINDLKIQIATLSQSIKSINMGWFYEQKDTIH